MHEEEETKGGAGKSSEEVLKEEESVEPVAENGHQQQAETSEGNSPDVGGKKQKK